MPETETKKNKRVGSTIFRIILIVIAGLTVGYGVFSWNAASLVGNQLPMPFGVGASVVMSSSMEPVLHVNDLVFVHEQESYEVDDVVVYQDGNMLVIHRIIESNDDTIVTQGDANNVADEPIETNQIKGKMVFRIPYIGMIFKYIKTVPGTLLILLLAVFLLYRSRQKERQADQTEMDSIVEEIRRLQALQKAAVDAKTDSAESSVAQTADISPAQGNPDEDSAPEAETSADSEPEDTLDTDLS